MSIDIETRLNYEVDTKKKPYFFAYPRSAEERKELPEHVSDFGGRTTPVKVLVRDGRQKGLKFDDNSFELVEQKTSLSTSDFYENPEKIITTYYNEMIELIKKETGAAHVIVFHHQVRNAKLNTGGIQNLNTPVQGYAAGIHTDSHVEHSDSMFNQYTTPEAMAKYRKGRYLYMNCWRNISETPIANNHLAVLDQTSVTSPDDYLATDLFIMQGMHQQQYRLTTRNSHRHRWYYYSQMKKNEVLMFKQFDSDPERSGRMSFHTAFVDPQAPADAPVRESIEIRAFAFFPDHQPNTCPEPAEEEEEKDDPNEDPEVTRKVIEDGAKAIIKLVTTLDAWPESAIVWLKSQVSQGKTGIHTAATILSLDDQGHLGLKRLSSTKKAKIAKMLMADGKFEETLLNALKNIPAKKEPREPSEKDIITNAAKKVLNSLKYVDHWPQASVDWFKSKAALGTSGIEEIATTMVADPQGHLQLNSLSENHKKEIVKSLLSDKDFEAVINAGLEKLKI